MVLRDKHTAEMQARPSPPLNTAASGCTARLCCENGKDAVNAVGFSKTERNRFHGHFYPVQIASLPGGYHFTLRPLVPPLSAELPKSGGDDARARIARRSHDDLPLGALLRTELEQRCRPHLDATNDSWRVDETYIKVKKAWMYLYRAVDAQGNTLEFLLSPRRDGEAAKRFFFLQHNLFVSIS